MKKIFALALGVAAIFSAQAQTTDVKALYEQAKKLDDAYNKVKADPDVNASKGLLEAVELYGQVLEAEKDAPKPKYTKKVQDALSKHAAMGDYNVAAVALFNGNARYPEAYNAFMLSGATASQLGLLADTIVAMDFNNAGNAAYGTDFPAAIVAYDAAIANNTTNPDTYVYAIGARQNLAIAQPELKDKLYNEIHEVAKKGVDKFGVGQDFLFNNYMQKYFDAEDYEAADYVLKNAIMQTPDNANLYRLQGILANAKHEWMEAVPAFEKMAELTDNYDYLMKAADDLNSVGKAVMGAINNPTPEVKQQILDIFAASTKIADKAKTVAGDNIGKVNYLIEDIQYNVENAQKL